MRGIVHVSACQGGVVHLSIGAITVRLDQETFKFVAEEIIWYAEAMQESLSKGALTMVKGGVL